jgi:hypothetical protein
MKMKKIAFMIGIINILLIILFVFSGCATTKENEPCDVFDKNIPISEQCLFIRFAPDPYRILASLDGPGEVFITAFDGIPVNWPYDMPLLIPAGEHTLTVFYHESSKTRIGVGQILGYDEYQVNTFYTDPVDIIYNFSPKEKYTISPELEGRNIKFNIVTTTRISDEYFKKIRKYSRNVYEIRHTRYIGLDYQWDDEARDYIIKNEFRPGYSTELGIEKELGFTFVNTNYHPWMRLATNFGLSAGLPSILWYTFNQNYEDGKGIFEDGEGVFVLGYTIGGLICFLPTNNFGINLGLGMNGDIAAKRTGNTGYESLNFRPYARFGLSHIFKAVDINYYFDCFLGDYTGEELGYRTGLILKF